MENPVIEVSIDAQRLRLAQGGRVLFEVQASTARNGPGETAGSECTPRGWHVVRAKIGADCAPNTVFVGRRPSGELYSPALRARFPQRDWILTRLLWLSGLEVGKNRLGKVDTMRRYVYIHGCPDEDDLRTPTSHGCVKLHNGDIIALFERVTVGTRVLIS